MILRWSGLVLLGLTIGSSAADVDSAPRLIDPQSKPTEEKPAVIQTGAEGIRFDPELCEPVTFLYYYDFGHVRIRVQGIQEDRCAFEYLFELEGGYSVHACRLPRSIKQVAVRWSYQENPDGRGVHETMQTSFDLESCKTLRTGNVFLDVQTDGLPTALIVNTGTWSISFSPSGSASAQYGSIVGDSVSVPVGTVDFTALLDAVQSTGRRPAQGGDIQVALYKEDDRSTVRGDEDHVIVRSFSLVDTSFIEALLQELDPKWQPEFPAMTSKGRLDELRRLHPIVGETASRDDQQQRDD